MCMDIIVEDKDPNTMKSRKSIKETHEDETNSAEDEEKQLIHDVQVRKLQTFIA